MFVKSTQSELTELDQVIKRNLRKTNMLVWHVRDDRLYMKRKDWGRGHKSLRAVYEETRLHVGCYMLMFMKEEKLGHKKREWLN